jgi:hypothetical protein
VVQTAATTADVSRSVVAGELIVVVFRQRSGNPRTYTLSQTVGTAISFTKEIQTDNTVAGCNTVIWWGHAATTESITVRNTASAADTGDLFIISVTGHDTTTPIRGSGIEYNTSTATNHDVLGTGVNVEAGDIAIGNYRTTGSGGTVTNPTSSTALITETNFGAMVYREFGSASSGERMIATTTTARTSECAGIVIAVAAATSFFPPRPIIISQAVNRAATY